MSQTALETPPFRFLTPEQLSRSLKVSPRMLERMRIEGTGPRYIRLGYRTVRYSVEAVQEWLESRGQEEQP